MTGALQIVGGSVALAFLAFALYGTAWYLSGPVESWRKR